MSVLTFPTSGLDLNSLEATQQLSEDDADGHEPLSTPWSCPKAGDGGGSGAAGRGHRATDANRAVRRPGGAGRDRGAGLRSDTPFEIDVRDWLEDKQRSSEQNSCTARISNSPAARWWMLEASTARPTISR